MPESGFYAPGTEFMPSAPWNQTEQEDCSECGGAGCPHCNDTGIEPEDPDIEFGPDPDDLRDAALDRAMEAESQEGF